MTGNLGTQRLYLVSGNPTNISLGVINPEKGSLVLDITTPALYQKTTNPGDNSGYQLIQSGASATTTPYAATITPSVVTGINQGVNVGTLTGNITIANPIGTAVDFQTLKFRFTQDGMGGKIITWGNAFDFGADITEALIPTTASAKWEIVFEWCVADSLWRAVGIARGF